MNADDLIGFVDVASLASAGKFKKRSRCASNKTYFCLSGVQQAEFQLVVGNRVDTDV